MTGRIIVADDHPLFREGMLRTLQRLLPDASLEEAGDLAGVVHLAEQGEEPDSLILDLRFPGLTRIDLLADLRRRFPRTALIVVSMVDDPQLIAEVMDAGVDGFLGKSIAPEELGEAILAIRAGEVLVRYEPSGLLPLESSALLDGLTERQARRPPPAGPGQEQQGDRPRLGHLPLHRADPCLVAAQGARRAVAHRRGGEVPGGAGRWGREVVAAPESGLRRRQAVAAHLAVSPAWSQQCRKARPSDSCKSIVATACAVPWLAM